MFRQNRPPPLVTRLNCFINFYLGLSSAVAFSTYISKAIYMPQGSISRVSSRQVELLNRHTQIHVEYDLIIMK